MIIVSDTAGYTLYDRLSSIILDAKFISDLCDSIPFPAVPNERCGSWYLENIEKAAAKVYFKSTDGHYGNWSFNQRRMNLGILPLIIKHKGLIIIDSTQKGKKMPDALSKTIPIWCCVLNRYIMLSDNQKKNMFDGNLHTPLCISKSENDQIMELIPEFVNGLKNLKLESEHLHKLDKPLRPIWITPKSTIIDDWDDFPFYPIVCVTASGDHSVNLFKYVKGAADDHELWGHVGQDFYNHKGLTAELFWKHKDYLLKGPPQLVKARIENILYIKDSPIDGRFQKIGNTSLFIGNFSSGKPPDCWMFFDVVVNCCSDEFADMKAESYLFLNIPNGKKGGNQLLKCIPILLNFIKPYILEKKRILLHSRYGMDRAVGLLICIFLEYFSHIFTTSVSKSSIMEAIWLIQADWVIANPSRSTLRKITTYFLSKNH